MYSYRLLPYNIFKFLFKYPLLRVTVPEPPSKTATYFHISYLLTLPYFSWWYLSHRHIYLSVYHMSSPLECKLHEGRVGTWLLVHCCVPRVYNTAWHMESALCVHVGWISKDSILYHIKMIISWNSVHLLSLVQPFLVVCIFSRMLYP